MAAPLTDAQKAALAERLLRERLRRLETDSQARDSERSLYSFVQMFWHIVEPQRPFVKGWTMQAICDHLQACDEGGIHRLLVNVPPGYLKEVWVEEPVLTTRGRIRLGDVVLGDRILTHRGRYREVTGVHDKGQQPTLWITTSNGRRVRPELRHPFLTTRGWVEAGDLKVGDVLAAVQPVEQLPDQITPEEARLLGYFVGGGSVKGTSPKFAKDDEEVLADFERCCAAVGATASRETIPPARVAPGATLRITGLSGWLERFDLRGRSRHDKRIPAAVLASGPEVLANFLGAYASCATTMKKVQHAGNREPVSIAVCSTRCEGLARDVQHALLRLGISSRVRRGISFRVPALTKKMPTKRKGETFTYWMVSTTSDHETSKFNRLKGLSARKLAAVTSLSPRTFEQGPLHADEIIAIEDAGMAECRCLTVEEDHSFTAGDLAVHNSLTTNVFFPAWVWGPRRKPSLRFISASYASHLTVRDNTRFRQVIQSDLYRKLWGDVFAPSDASFNVIKVANNKTGWKLATSVTGIGTGERADYFLVDDPNSVQEAESETILRSTNQWFREVVPTRLNDLATGVIIVIQQRTNELDVSGTILDSADDLGYEHACIPAEYEVGRQCVTVLARDADGNPVKIWQDPRGCDDDGISLEEPGLAGAGLAGDALATHMAERRAELESREGMLAFPERFGPDVTSKLKAVLGPYGVAAQLQQRPAPRGGAIFKEEWWQPWPPEGFVVPEGQPVQYPPMSFIVASLDPAYEEKAENDFSALTVWGIWTGRVASGGGVVQLPRQLAADSPQPRDGGMRQRQQGPMQRRDDDPEAVFLQEANGPRLMLMYAWQKRLDLHGPPEQRPPGMSDKEWNAPWMRRRRQATWGLVEWTLDTCRRYRVDTLLVEAKASGISVVQELRRLYADAPFNIVKISPDRDKVARAHSVVPIFANLIVHAPMDPSTGAPSTVWCQQVLSQASMFPKGRKDLVDSVVQAVQWLRNQGLILRSDEADYNRREMVQYRKQGATPLYPV